MVQQLLEQLTLHQLLEVHLLVHICMSKAQTMGQRILNHQITPNISIQNGKDSELRAIISNGK